MTYPDRSILAPTELPGCFLWLDASDSASVTRDGSNLVSQWSDKSGNSNHATQSTGSNKPTYNATGYSGFPCIDWGATPGAGVGLVTPAVSYGPFTAFFVIDGIAGGGYVYSHFKDSGNQDYLYRVTAGYYVSRGSVPTSKNFTAAAGGANWYVGKKVVTRRFDGLHLTSIARARGNILETVTLGGGGNDPGTALTGAGAMGIGNYITPTEAFRGTMAEIIFFNRALSDGEVAAVERYLNRKWLVQSVERLISSPLEIPDCAMWFNAGQGITSDVNGVSQWNDSSGNGRHIAQSDNSFKPTYNPSNAVFGGEPTVDWAAGTSQRLDRSVADNLSQPLTIFACASLGAANTLLKALFNNVSGTEHTIVIRDSVANGWQWYSAGPLVNFPYPNVGTKPFVLSAASGGVGVRLAVNGTALVNAGATFSAGAITTFRLGGNVNGGLVSRNWFGSIAEFLVYTRKLSEGEIATVEAYLRQKYALQSPRQIASPLDILNCAVWLDASDASSVSKDGSDLVSQWNDKSGNANHFTATGTARPTYSAYNGYPILSFNGSTNTMTATSNVVDASTGSTIIVACRKRTGSASTNKAGVTTRSNALYIDTPFSVWGGYTGGIKPATGDPVGTSMRTFVVRRGASNLNGAMSLRSDGVGRGSFTTGGDDARGTTDISSTAGSQASDIDVLEVVIYQRALTDGECALVERYLANKYNLLA